MNKFYTILLFLILLTGRAFCQNSGTDVKNKYFGVKAGANFANFTGDAEGTSTLTSFHGGLYALYMDSEFFGIQPEIQYSGQGVALRNGHLRMHYAVVPVMLKVFPVPAFSIQAGPYAAFLLSDKVETDSYPAQYTVQRQWAGFRVGLWIVLRQGKQTNCQRTPPGRVV